MAPLPDFRPPVGDHLGIENRISPDLDILPYDSVCSDFNARADLSFRMNNGGGVNFQISLLQNSS
jgi:hypothetical protein